MRLNNSTLVIIPLILAAAGCMETANLVHRVTFGVGLPPNSKIVATKQDRGIMQDPRSYLIFDTDVAGIRTFAKNYSGVPLEQLLTARTQIHGASSVGTWRDREDGLPWDLTVIKNGRFFRRKGTNGFLSIDLDENRVYVFR